MLLWQGCGSHCTALASRELFPGMGFGCEPPIPCGRTRENSVPFWGWLEGSIPAQFLLQEFPVPAQVSGAPWAAHQGEQRIPLSLP